MAFCMALAMLYVVQWDLNNELLLFRYTYFQYSNGSLVLDHRSNTGPVFKWWSEYQTEFSPVLNTRPFGNQTLLTILIPH